MHIILALNQLILTLITLGAAYPGETMSSCAYRMDQQHKPWGRFWRPLIDWLFAWQRRPHGHCEGAYQNLLSGYSLPPEVRNLYHTK